MEFFANYTNSTNNTELSTAAPSNKNFSKLIFDSCLLLISVIGVTGNSVALFILSSSRKIRKNTSYTLLMNQCIIDIFCCLLSQFTLVTKYTMRNDRRHGVIDWCICSFVHSQIFLVIVTCASSLNLGLLTAEKMVSILWPIYHRVRCNERLLKAAGASMWLLGAGLMLAHSIPTNGINPMGRCYFWNRLSTTFRAETYAVTFNLFFNLIPFAVMSASYAAIYARLSLYGVGKDVKVNVVKMLASCVCTYFLCHSLRLYLSLASRFTDRNWMTEPIFMFAVALVQVNTLVNPVIFALQYRDYRAELGYQWNRLLGRRGVGDSYVRRDASSSSGVT